ncbi:hypothetical protein [Amycolatopsis sp. NPDC052450]|uniref:hypothetical protein n=1 Tax=Amycolatopsis sp. NPDC052450 TaxID=3363937 RepID=UPI0037CAD23E
MTEPKDEQFDPLRSILAEIVVTCGSKADGDTPHQPDRRDAPRRLRSFTFRRMESRGGRIGDWDAVRTLDEDGLDARDERAQGGIFPIPRGWRIVCPTCGHEQRFNRERLGSALDNLAAAGLTRIPLATLARVCAQ